MPPEDYEAIEAAVMDTARGRWFLAEFARRNRSADTSLLLTAIERLEALLGTGQALLAPPKPHQPITNDALATSAKSELFAVERPTPAKELPLPSVPDDVAWVGGDDDFVEEPPRKDVVEIDDQPPILPAAVRPATNSAAPAQSAMLAAALAHAEQQTATEAIEPETSPGGVSPAAADPAELDALSFEEKSVYFA
jgi:hypothetical protein